MHVGAKLYNDLSISYMLQNLYMAFHVAILKHLVFRI